MFDSRGYLTRRGRKNGYEKHYGLRNSVPSGRVQRKGTAARISDAANISVAVEKKPTVTLLGGGAFRGRRPGENPYRNIERDVRSKGATGVLQARV